MVQLELASQISGSPLCQPQAAEAALCSLFYRGTAGLLLAYIEIIPDPAQYCLWHQQVIVNE